jgi:NADPH-dependent glutamate synthase beta subunit-like oxidoreductase/glutamate synthase domain-containing protein 3/NAD-dependent dihydropyrimidine dehydrogenase PreA subunit
MTKQESREIAGQENGIRVESRVMEEQIQRAVLGGYRHIKVKAYGQHGIGGRLWRAGEGQIKVDVTGMSGQRLGSMGFANTVIEAFSSASDDVGWLNAGAQIIVHGNATNGVANAMAQGKIYIDGNIGARGMTMTKHNPRFKPPELWVFGKAGDSFAEFMAGGIAVVCGVGAERENDVLGYRPCVGMVGGKIFFRGRQRSYSKEDARLFTELPDDEWRWLKNNLSLFLKGIGKEYLFDELTSKRAHWNLLIALEPSEKKGRALRPMSVYRKEQWERELGKGGLIGDLTTADRTSIGLITTGALRRFAPVWANEKYLPPCQAHCPTGIPVQKRWELIRKGKMQEAVNLALEYTPFPATVCGYLCPNLCMENCSRQKVNLPSVDVTVMGKASLNAKEPKPLPVTGRKIAVIGGGAAGLSVAWQLWMKGHEAVVFEGREKLGGKVTETIPQSRIPNDVIEHEINRFAKNVRHVHYGTVLTKENFWKLKNEFDVVVIAAGAVKSKNINVPGIDKAMTALDFLKQSKLDRVKVGENVVIIGAGNVGCDAATEAFRLGAKTVTLIDVQQPASFGAERRHAEAAGAKFIWPSSSKAITVKGVELTDGKTLPADTVIVAVGDLPDLSFLPEEIITKDGFVAVDKQFRTNDEQVFAIGDVVNPGLLTEAIGAGRIAARAIDNQLRGVNETNAQPPPIDFHRVKTEYFDSRIKSFSDPVSCATNCLSCGACRDCGMCETICPQNAISRKGLNGDNYEYIVNEDLCIGCGFCAGVCPTGVWEIVENIRLE